MSQQKNEPTQRSKTIWVIILVVSFLVGGILDWRCWWIPKEESIALGVKAEEVKKNETINWKNYSNPETNFTFKYPKDWEIKDYKYKSAACQVKPGCKGVQVIELKRRGEIKTLISINMPQCTGINRSDLPGNNWICVFDESPEVLNGCEQIKKSFQLIKDESADWKTYRNEKYGFEINYPENFSVKEHTYYESEFVIEIVEKKWGKLSIHSPGFFLSIFKSAFSPRDWIDEKYDPIPEVEHSTDPPTGYSNVKHNQINNMPVLQFKIWGANGSNDSTLIKKEPYLLYKLDAHHSANGMFPKDIYDQMLATFRFLK